MTEEKKEQVEQVETVENTVAETETEIEKVEVEPEAEKVEVVAETEIEKVEVVAETEDSIDEVDFEETNKKKKAVRKPIVDPVAEADEDFDWEGLANEKVNVSKNREELELLYDKTLSTIQEKECVDGIVISMNKREVVVNIGYKSDAVEIGRASCRERV